MVHNPDDLAFLRSIASGVIEEFRAEMFQASFIKKNPHKFVDNAWVDIDDLKAFIATRKGSDEHATRVPIIKKERESSPVISVKQEQEAFNLSHNSDSLGYQTIIENGQEVMVLLSSDDEDSNDHDNSSVFGIPYDDVASSDTVVEPDTSFTDHTFLSDSERDDEIDLHDHFMSSASDPVSEADSELDLDLDGSSDSQPEPSTTDWLDPAISSTVRHGSFQVTRQCTVETLEYLSDIPSYWPVPRDSRAYILDLSDPKYDIKDKDGNLLPVDALIKNFDQDSWTGCSGNGRNDTRPKTTIFSPDDEPILCRRSRLSCAGYGACEYVSPELVDIERYELDPTSLEDVVQSQVNTRMEEGNSCAKLALTFFAICHSSPCTAKGNNGRVCTGVPVLRKYRDNATKNGHQHFIACTGWTNAFRDGHRSASIPSGVKDEDLAILFAGGELPGIELFPCGRVVPAHIGAKLKYCQYPHKSNGTRAKIVRHSCSASRTIFVPDDPTIRKACIVPNYEEPHTHPILPATKASAAIRDLYKKCVNAAGVVGSSVRTVDNAQTTKMLLNKAPSLFSPALQNSRVKQDIIREVKKEKYPCGKEIPGVVHLMTNDLEKPLENRYIHSYTTTPAGGSIVLTGDPFLLKRIHSASSLFVDTTFKRTAGSMKEWEVVMWDTAIQRAVSICRVYSNRSDRAQYKAIFDQLRSVTRQLTGRDLKLKKLSVNGTLVSIGVDLELAQVLGAGDSFLETNEPEYSNLHNPTAEEIVEHFIRGCYTHAKRGVQDLKPYVTEAEFDRLVNFMYLKTKEEVDEFSTWIKDLKNPKVQAWWDHKINNKWILPSLIKCLSKIDPEDWDRTPSSTNIGESQHHWTNINTGIQLSLVEAIETARECDNRVAAEIAASLQSGVLKNHRNDTFTRMSRSTARATLASKKVKETRDKNNALSQVQHKIDAVSAVHKESAAQLKALKEEKGKIASATKAGKGSKAESNSSGRVRSSTAVVKGKARAAAKSAILKSAIKPSSQFSPLGESSKHSGSKQPTNLDVEMVIDENESFFSPSTSQPADGPAILPQPHSLLPNMSPTVATDTVAHPAAQFPQFTGQGHSTPLCDKPGAVNMPSLPQLQDSMTTPMETIPNSYDFFSSDSTYHYPSNMDPPCPPFSYYDSVMDSFLEKFPGNDSLDMDQYPIGHDFASAASTWPPPSNF